MAETDSKRCPRCGETKPLSAFGKSKGRKHGVKGFCRPCHNATNKESRGRNPVTSGAASSRWKKNNPDRCRANLKAWEARNPGKTAQMARDWRSRNPDKVQAAREARQSRIDWRLKRTLSSRIRLLALGKSGRRTVDLIGYSMDDLRGHLERQFRDGMTWDNYGEWHIDHIIPLASFSFTSLDDPELRRAWSLPNLRPLWAKENMRKHDKVLHLI